MTSLYMDEAFLDRMGGIAGLIRDSISWGIERVFAFTIWLVAALGFPGIVIAMAIESACIPLPSELIMPLAGFEVSDGRMNVPLIDNNFVDLFAVSVAGALGCVLGSVAAYWAGYKGGRPFVEKQGRYILISKRDIEMMDKIFHRYGMITVFLTRMMPVVRTFISLPAGISRMPFKRFVIYTFTGSLPWCFLLAWIGYILGKNWEKVGEYLHKVDIVIVALGITAVIAFLIYKRHEIVVWFNLVFRRKGIE